MKKGKKKKHTQNGVQVENNRNGRQKKTNQPFPVGQTIETGRWSSRLPFFVPFLIERETKKKNNQQTSKENPKNGGNPVKKNSVKHRLFPNFRVLRWLKVKKKKTNTWRPQRTETFVFFIFYIVRSVPDTVS